MKLKSIVPWGRTFEEYVKMFALSRNDLKKSLLGCGDGPAGFNAGMNKRGHRMISCDPIYAFAKKQIAQRITEAQDEVMPEVYLNMADYVWKNIKTPEELLLIRRSAMQEFLDDYDRGKKEGRYMTASVTELPFQDGMFDIALCSHFLFLYDNLGLEFHVKAINEMLRTAKEARIFPVKDIHCKTSLFLAPLQRSLREAGYRVETVSVDYEFQKSANEMLKISRHVQRAWNSGGTVPDSGGTTYAN